MTNKVNLHLDIWSKKEVTREIYKEWYQMLTASMLNDGGETLELGSGTGNYKKFNNKIIASDIQKSEFIDVCLNAEFLPFSDNTLSNILLIDVIHHLSDPLFFMDEAFRTLKKGGRIILLEPFPSLFSRIVYFLFHKEPFKYNVDYFSGSHQHNKNPWDSNQAIPYLLFFKNINKFKSKYNVNIVKKEKLAFFLYPLSGGFEGPSLINLKLYKLLKPIESFLSIFKDVLAFRCFVILEKK